VPHAASPEFQLASGHTLHLYESLHHHAEFDKLTNEYPYEKNYATTRLDDDDGLSENFVALLQQYKDNDQCIVSFPFGNLYKIETTGSLRANEIMNQRKLL
jgi:hypothetical protein